MHCGRLDKSVLATIAVDIKEGKRAVLASAVSAKRSESGKQGGRGHVKQTNKNAGLLSGDADANATVAAAHQVGVSPAYVKLAEQAKIIVTPVGR